MARPATSLAELKAAKKILAQKGLPASRYQLQRATGAAYATIDRLLPLLDLPDDEKQLFSGLNEKLAEMLQPVTQGLLELADEQFAVERADLNKQRDALDAQLQQQDVTIGRLTQEKDQLIKTITGLNTDMEATASTLAHCNNEIISLQSNVSNLQSINKERADQIASLHQQLEKSRQDINHFRDASAKQRQLEIDQFNTEKQGLYRQQQTLKESNITLQTEITTLKAAISSDKQALARLSSDLTSARKDTEKSQRLVEKQEKQMALLQTKLENSVSDIKTLKQENKLLSQQAVETAKENATLTHDNKSLRSDLVSLEKQVLKIETQLETKEKLIKQLLQATQGKRK